MTFYLLDLYVLAALCVFLAVLCGGAGLVCWIGQAIDDRHTRRLCDCDEADAPDDCSVTIGPCEPGHCRVCDEAYEAEIERERER